LVTGARKIDQTVFGKVESLPRKRIGKRGEDVPPPEEGKSLIRVGKAVVMGRRGPGLPREAKRG